MYLDKVTVPASDVATVHRNAMGVQESEVEQQLCRLEDAVLMLQGCPYMLAANGPLLRACRQRAAPQARVSHSIASSNIICLPEWLPLAV